MSDFLRFQTRAERSRIAMQKLRDARRAAGLCLFCGDPATHGSVCLMHKEARKRRWEEERY